MTYPQGTPWTQLISLELMENTIRRMTARYTEAQMSTAQIDNYINRAYTLHFPLQFKNIKLTKPFVFNTVPNVDTYQFVYEQGTLSIGAIGRTAYYPGSIQITPPVYCQGYILRYFQDKMTFYNRWPNLSVNQQISSGVGAPNTYTGTIPPFPFLRAQQDIFGNVTEPAVIISSFDNTGFNWSITDKPVANSNTGNLVDILQNIVGSVNYVTGAYSFTATIPSGDPIYAAVVPYQSSRPTDILFYNQQIVLRPVPMQVYQMEFQISMQPTQLIASGQAPELDEWYLFICALAADLIYNDFPDPIGRAELQKTLDEQRLLAQRRTLRQMGSQRAATIFSQPGRPVASWFWGTEYSGTSG